MNLSKKVKLVRHEVAVAAGSSNNTPSAGVDTQGYRGCCFVVSWGTIVSAGVQSIEAHQATTLAGSYAALLGTKVTVADDDDDKVTYLDIYEPRERFLKCIQNRATQNSTIDGCLAILYDPTDAPPTHDATTVSGGETHVAPAEGTA